MPTIKKNIAVIGFGNMMEAIISGALKENTLSSKQVFAIQYKPQKDKTIQKKYKITHLKNYEEICKNCQVIFLGVKPQGMNSVLQELKPYITKNHLLITVAAGLPVSFYEKRLGKNIRLIRTMPNTPALIGLGATGYFANKNCKRTDTQICETIFQSIGIIKRLKKESLIDSVIAVSGSAPAFVYQFASSLIKGGIKNGLTENESKDLVLQTLKGATEMMIHSPETPDELTKKVTSKKGTTLEGLKVLKKKKFTNLIWDCMKAAIRRSKELSKELS